MSIKITIEGNNQITNTEKKENRKKDEVNLENKKQLQWKDINDEGANDWLKGWRYERNTMEESIKRDTINRSQSKEKTKQTRQNMKNVDADWNF